MVSSLLAIQSRSDETCADSRDKVACSFADEPQFLLSRVVDGLRYGSPMIQTHGYASRLPNSAAVEARRPKAEVLEIILLPLNSFAKITI